MLLLRALLFLLLAATSSSVAIRTMIAAGDVLCFKEVIPKQTSVIFQFSVFGGGGQTITAALKDHEGKTLQIWQDSTEGSHHVRAREKIPFLKACFDNRNSFYSIKTFSFHFRQHIDYEMIATEHELDPIETKVEELAAAMMEAETVQMQMQEEQKEHRMTVEATNERLLYWSVFQIVALFGMSTFQLYFLKRFLERKSFV